MQLINFVMPPAGPLPNQKKFRDIGLEGFSDRADGPVLSHLD
jgi:hypothetical protein